MRKINIKIKLPSKITSYMYMENLLIHVHVHVCSLSLSLSYYFINSSNVSTVQPSFIVNRFFSLFHFIQVTPHHMTPTHTNLINDNNTFIPLFTHSFIHSFTHSPLLLQSWGLVGQSSLQSQRRVFRYSLSLIH